MTRTTIKQIPDAALAGELERLFCLLDDIDTLDDACRSDDAAFREQVRAIQRKRFDGGITTDGYTLDLTTLSTRTPTDGLAEEVRRLVDCAAKGDNPLIVTRAILAALSNEGTEG